MQPRRQPDALRQHFSLWCAGESVGLVVHQGAIVASFGSKRDAPEDLVALFADFPAGGCDGVSTADVARPRKSCNAGTHAPIMGG